jgi:folate/biopterin transporter
MGEYFRRLRDYFGYRFIALLFLTQCMLKGIAFYVMAVGLFPLFKALGVDAVQFQILGAVALSPWTLKPFIGVISDLFAIGGYHKRYYMLISMVGGITGGFFMIFGLHESPMIISFFALLVHFEISVCDLLMEGKYAEIMRKHQDSGADIITLANGFQQLGSIVALCFIGPLADQQLFWVSNTIVVVALCTPIVPVLFGWLPEERVTQILDRAQLRENWKIIAIAAMTGIMAPATAAITAFANQTLGIISASIVLVVAVIGGYVAMPNRIIAHVALYQALTAVSRISFSGALDYFFTANEACLPGGPAFSNTFYITTTGIIGQVASFVTVGLYQLLFSNWKFRTVLILTSVLSALGGIFDFIIVMRWNLAIGIPDSWFFIIGDDVIHSIVEMLYWIPSSAIIGKVCPANMEASTYAYLAGVSNFSSMISSLAGAWITAKVGIVTVAIDSRTATNCYWVPLPWLILFGHVVLMLVISIPAAWLIPNISQRESLLPPVPLLVPDPQGQEEDPQIEEIPLDFE